MSDGALRVLHISDPHLFGGGELHYAQVDTTRALRNVLEHCASLGALDLVVVSGDCSDDGSAASYRKLEVIVGSYATEHGARPIYAMGNHDRRAGFCDVLGDGHGRVLPSRGETEPIDAVSEVNGFRIVAMDTSVPGKAYGDLRPAQLTWLSEQLSSPSADGTVLVVHHPPVAACTSLLHTMELMNPEALADSIAGSDVRLILAGHFHHQLAGSLRGVPVVVTPGVANRTDPTTPPGIQRTTYGSGATLVHLDAQGLRATSFNAPASEDGTVLSLLDAAQIADIAQIAGSPDWKERLAEAIR